MEKKPSYLLLLLTIFSINSAYSQFEINSFETTHIDSTSQEEREALFLYRNYPDKFFNNSDLNTTKKYNFTILLLDGKTVNVKSQIFFTENKHFILNGSNKIYPQNTKRIIAHFDEYDFIGIPNDSCWLFRNNDDNDPIYTYSILPKNKSNSVLFIKSRNSNSSPKVLTKENVIELVENDHIVLDYALKSRLIFAIKQYNFRNYGSPK